MLDKYLHIIGKINYYLFIVAVCALPYPMHFVTYTWVAWLVTWALEGRMLQIKHMQWKKGIIPIICLLVWVIWEIISRLWAIDQSYVAGHISRHISFILIVPIAICGVNKNYNWTTIIKWFIISCVASIFIYATYIYIVRCWTYILEHHQLPKYIQTWRYFGDYISYLKHRLYYGTVLNIGIIALLQTRGALLADKRKYKTKYVFFYVILFILVLGVIWSSSRANMLTLLVVCAVAIIQPLKGRTRNLVTALVTIHGIIICTLLFSLHPRFEQIKFGNIIGHITEEKVDDTTNIEPRINIWSIAITNYEDYVWHGVGAGGDTEYLKRLYDSQNWNKYYAKQYNAHNQYLAVFINLGIFAVILFIFIWLFYPLWYQSRLRQTAALISLTFGLNMLSENMFDRVDGIIIASLTMLSIVLISRVQHEE